MNRFDDSKIIAQEVVEFENTQAVARKTLERLIEKQDQLNQDLQREAEAEELKREKLRKQLEMQKKRLCKPPKTHEPYIRELPKTGRNEPCPCGSGLKYKKCHLGKEAS